MDQKMKSLHQDLQLLAAQLEPKHVSWIIQGALTHFEKRIEEVQNRLLRLGLRDDEPVLTRYGSCDVGESRNEANADLVQYRLIMRVLLALDRLQSHASALELALEFARYARKKI